MEPKKWPKEKKKRRRQDDGMTLENRPEKREGKELKVKFNKIKDWEDYKRILRLQRHV